MSHSRLWLLLRLPFEGGKGVPEKHCDTLAEEKGPRCPWPVPPCSLRQYCSSCTSNNCPHPPLIFVLSSNSCHLLRAELLLIEAGSGPKWGNVALSLSWDCSKLPSDTWKEPSGVGGEEVERRLSEAVGITLACLNSSTANSMRFLKRT